MSLAKFAHILELISLVTLVSQAQNVWRCPIGLGSSFCLCCSTWQSMGGSLRDNHFAGRGALLVAVYCSKQLPCGHLFVLMSVVALWIGRTDFWGLPWSLLSGGAYGLFTTSLATLGYMSAKKYLWTSSFFFLKFWSCCPFYCFKYSFLCLLYIYKDSTFLVAYFGRCMKNISTPISWEWMFTYLL